jgi:adenylate cyclase
MMGAKTQSGKADIFSGKIVQTIGLGTAGAVIALAIWLMGWDSFWEAKTWDWRVRLLAKNGKATHEICLILLDQNSLDWGKNENSWSWPWPREIYSVIINFCKRSHVKSLAVDVLFTEPSAYGVEDDVKLGSAMSDFGKIAGAVFIGQDKTTFPIPEVANNARLLCNVRLLPDSDGVYRRIPLSEVFKENAVPSLGIGAYLAALPPHQDIQAALKKIDETVPKDAGKNAILRYRGTHTAYSAAAIIQSELRILAGETPVISPELLKDKYVFLGFSAPGLYDLRPSPISGVFPGVEIHATLLDNFLSQDFIHQMPRQIVVFLILLMALVGSASMSALKSPVSIVMGSLLNLSLPILFALWCYVKGWWMPIVVCEISSGTAMLLCLAVSYATEGRQKRFIKQAFRQYMSHEVVEQLIEHPDMLKLGGQRKMLSIFFSDIQGFTSISEKLEPEELTAFLNDYLTAMTDIIMEEGGTVDKYEGDAIIAFWNAPLDLPEHAIRCTTAALRCQEKLKAMRPVFYERIRQNTYMRIGVNTGYAVVGNFGSQTKFDYTMIGDSVNLAARLEGVNKQFGTYTMISEFTKEQLKDAVAVREIAKVAVVGRREPVKIYEPMAHKEYQANREIFETFAKGLNLFYAGDFDKAESVFSSIADRDPAAGAYRIKSMEMKHAKPEHWQGVWVMSSK